MNMVVCRHPNDNGKYIFRVPEDITIDAGELVRVETSRGIQPAQCLTQSFNTDPEVACPMWGTQPEKMKRVISVLHESYLDWPDEPKNGSAYNEDEEP